MPNRKQRRAALALARKSRTTQIQASAVAPTKVQTKTAKNLSRITATASVSIQAAEGQPTTKRFEIRAYTGEPMTITGWNYPVVIELDSMNLSAQRIPILYDHVADVDFIVGQSDSVSKDDVGVLVRGSLNGVSDYAEKIRTQAANGYIWQASVGADPQRVELVEKGQSITLNGRTYDGPVYVGYGCVLREVSFVVLGGDRNTTAVVARREQSPKPIKGRNMNFEQYLADLGFSDPTAIPPEQMTKLVEAYAKAYASSLEETEETMTEASGDMTESTDIQTPTNAASSDPATTDPMPTNAAANPPAVQASSAVVQSQTRTQQPSRLEQIRAGRNQSPHLVIRNNSTSLNLEAMAGAVLMRCGGRLDSPTFQHPLIQRLDALPQWMRASINDPAKNQIMDRAHELSSMSILDMAKACLQAAGQPVPRDRFDLIRAAARIRGASSGSGFTNIFTTNVNAILLSAYLEGGDSTEGWTTTTDVADFKTNDRIRVQTGEGLTKNPRGAEADHTKFSDQMESYKISRYARQFVIDEIDFINDSLGAFSDTPRRFGLAAARLRPDLVYAIILANANLDSTSRALFNSTDGNTTTGTLTAANLKSAIQSMYKQRENSVNLNVQATHLLVPPALEFDAYELLQSPTIVVAGTTDTVRGSMNTLTKKQLQVVTDARLENGVTDPDTSTAYSGSATQWFLASTYMNTVEVAYLTGQGRSPRVRSWIDDKEGKFGLGWDVSLSIGAKALDWRGLWRRTG